MSKKTAKMADYRVKKELAALKRLARSVPATHPDAARFVKQILALESWLTPR